jgi:DNA-binding transcriptional ArsR family regulator
MDVEKSAMASVMQEAPTALSGAELAEMRSHAEDASRLLKTLGNSTRLLILCSLVDGELSVGRLNELVGMSQSALSQHLAVLRHAELVETRRESQTIFYSLSSNKATRIIEVLHDIYCPQTPL